MKIPTRRSKPPSPKKKVNSPFTRKTVCLFVLRKIKHHRKTTCPREQFLRGNKNMVLYLTLFRKYNFFPGIS